MPVATLTAVSKSYPGRTVLDAATLSVETGERLGLVGANGSGKTTLLRMLARELEPDSGEVQIARGARLGYVRQTDQLGGARTLEEALLEPFADLLKLHEEMEKVAHAMETDASLVDAFGELQHAYEAGGGYAYEAEMKRVARGLGFGEGDFAKSVATMSGGERSRAALARELLVKPSLLLLDEPTNHLDIAGVEWLEDYLNEFPGAVIVVSHDRWFLDRVTTRTAEVEDARVESYPGPYSFFVDEKEHRREAAAARFERQQEHIAKTEEYIRRFSAGQRAAQAKGRKRRLERLERLDRPQGSRPSLRVRFGPVHRSAMSAVTAKDVSKSFGERTLFRGATFVVERGDRVGIIGPNGSGKTTLLRILLGLEPPDSGKAAMGASVEAGYFDQTLSGLNGSKSVMDEVWSVDITLTREQLQSYLALFLFPGDAVHRHVGSLSGGEKSRVALAKLLLKRPNTLFLDEPTNHLDIPSRQALEEALDGYDGTIVTVSHDRYFLDRICDRILAIEGQGVADYRTDYSGVLEKRKLAASKPAAKAPEAPPEKKGASWEEQKEEKRRVKRIEKIQEEITALEKRIEQISENQCRPENAQAWAKLKEMEKEKAALKKKGEELYREWEQLEAGK